MKKKCVQSNLQNLKLIVIGAAEMVQVKELDIRVSLGYLTQSKWGAVCAYFLS